MKCSPLFWALLAFRVCNSLLVQTSFDPDEYWQSLEVAHRVVFGYGHLTWEWTAKVRGFSHPLIFALVYKVLQLSSLDFAGLVIYTPKILQAILLAIADYHLYLLAAAMTSVKEARFVLICQVMNWFTFYCGVRTLSNSLEMVLTILSLYHWPNLLYKASTDTQSRISGLVFIALSCIVRPTAATIWILPFVYELISFQDRLHFVLFQLLPMGIFGLALSCTIDRFFYGTWTVTVLNFLYFNTVSGGSSFYGQHSWHWYFSQGLPTMLFTQLPLAFLGAFLYPFSVFHLNIIGTLVAYSLFSHKEFRFIFSIIPICMIFAGRAMHKMSKVGFGRSISPSMSRKLIHILLLAQVPMMIYFSLVHQRGVLDVMTYLRAAKIEDCRRCPSNFVAAIDFLMPCHSTPLYSYIHKNISATFLDCSPPPFTKVSGYHGFLSRTESDMFAENCLQFLDQRYSGKQLPSHIILFEPAVWRCGSVLFNFGFSECSRFFHTFTPITKHQGDVVVLCATQH